MTLRSSIDRPEALDTGAITTNDLDPVAPTTAIRFGVSRPDGPERPADCRIENTCERIMDFILSTAFQHEFWSRLRWKMSSLPS